MTRAVQVIFNGHGNTVVRDLDAALHHVAHNLLTPRHDATRAVDRSIAEAYEEYDDLAVAGIKPGLAYVLRLCAESERRESVELVTHDLDASPNRDSVLSSYDLMSTPDPSYQILKAVIRYVNGEEHEDEIESGLIAAVDVAVRDARKGFFKSTPADVVALFRSYVSDLAGEGPALKEEDLAGDPETVLTRLPERAGERFRDAVRTLRTGTAPAP